MSNTLRIATFNIHKGMTSFNARMVLHEQREMIRKLQADIVFLQEVQGEHARHEPLFRGLQHEFLADSIWSSHAYGKNAVYPAGHHGNALLSKYPISKWENEDISAHATEKRGMLHCEMAVPGWDQPLHCVCTHLGLFGRWREQQILALRERIETLVPPHAPLIIAGDFNDWRMHASRILCEKLQLKEVFENQRGKPARSFPSVFPMLRLDRIYIRGFHVQQAQVYGGTAYAKISDHAALSAVLTRL
ncbi:ribosome biogenesis GTPase A [Novimethylophilus kurashikiensis]|uniref:Ribosome biogenesis GTPase A n=1 Tax=Novimethylophilus kurashikiensis TaxID=1825523 RepID=A0A2R5FA03_9PROT|nr:endonuclease/exonuclease/phosphatase family protein [Novimethylophilus kurashikiensis]GBG13521.1 ribosome biogenesis GTPase A [Novimethylophilus kurashikiensis]